jgi:hypothetical protein
LVFWNQCAFKHSSRSDPLNHSTKAVQVSLFPDPGSSRIVLQAASFIS